MNITVEMDNWEEMHTAVVFGQGRVVKIDIAIKAMLTLALRIVDTAIKTC